jgi:putative radical SAM enzyme (TIGR03279 family)
MALSLPVGTHEPNLIALERRKPKNVVETVAPDSAGEKAGVQVGDRVISVNGAPLRDIVDWRFQTAGERAELTFLRDDDGPGVLHTVVIDKGYDEDLGLTFTDDLFDNIHICKNKCVFCFLYQQPKGLRPSLYIKDDDYRLSFLHGNYVTLTNLKEGELDRICEQKLSPMFVSIHATDPVVRGKMLGRKQPEPILPILNRLADARIQIHGQVVLCPGYNDGEHLDQTIQELAALNPEARGTYGGVMSLAVVPIGITQFRDRLAPVTVVSNEYAGELLDKAEVYREKFRKELGSRFVFFSDEFYLGAKREVPPRSHYEGFPQLEDGVGLVRLFLDDLDKIARRLPKSVPTPRSFTLVTGESAGPLLQRFADVMNRVENLSVNVLVVHNRFFEGNISVAGLIVGRDLVDAIQGLETVGDTVIIPTVMMRDGEQVFLDEMTLEQVNEAVGRPVVAVERTPAAAASVMLR